MIKPLAVKKRDIVDILYNANWGTAWKPDEIAAAMGYVSHRPVRAALYELLASGAIAVERQLDSEDSSPYPAYRLSADARSAINHSQDDPSQWTDTIKPDWSTWL